MAPPTNLTKAELEALRMVKDGLLVKEIANILGVSEGAVKQRLRNAKSKLGAKNRSSGGIGGNWLWADLILPGGNDTPHG